MPQQTQKPAMIRSQDPAPHGAEDIAARREQGPTASRRAADYSAGGLISGQVVIMVLAMLSCRRGDTG
jgi:hypothetical protein